MGKPSGPSAWDRRSEAAKAYRKWYNLPMWRARRAAQLSAEPICTRCQKEGRLTPATVANHVIPHRGNWDIFIGGRLESLCKPHHDSDVQAEESAALRDDRRGYSTKIGEDGFPADPRHPFNSGQQIKHWGYSIPHGVKPSAIPVMLICGPPASGKSTYVRSHAQDGDTVIDFDAIRKIVGGAKWDQDKAINAKAFAYRDSMICGLKDKRSGTAWLIVMAPTKAERKAWTQALVAVTEIILIPPKDQCLSQMHGDPDRAATVSLQQGAITRWYAAYDGPSSAVGTPTA